MGNTDDTGKTPILSQLGFAGGAKAVTDALTALVVVLHPPTSNLGRRFTLTRTEYLIGRLDDLDLSIESESVSRRHARIFRTDDGWHVEDLGSTNGTHVNDEKVAGVRKLVDGDHVRCGEAILKFIAGAHVEAAYHEEIYRMSILDGMTGAHNKRFFEEFLEREIARAKRHGQQLSLVLFDIDHFKLVNDTHGHLGGDTVLRDLCKRLRPRIRREDLLARIGGEEFACILPETNAAGALLFAESVRNMVAGAPFVHDGTDIAVTISMGVTTLEPGTDLMSAEMIGRADANMYAAKRGGRNRVVA